MTTTLLLALTLGNLPTETPAGLFSARESVAVVEFWNQPGRVIYRDRDPARPHQPAATAEGSLWLYEYYKRRNPGEPLVPGQLPDPRTERHRQWDRWIDEQMARDKAFAEACATWQNHGLTGLPHLSEASPMPPDLRALAGDPPAFYKTIRAQIATVDLGRPLDFKLGVQTPPKYLYLRNELGVSASGPAMSMPMSAVPAPLRKPIEAIARLEGTPASVNTYDTGGVSFGMFQFASLEDGRGSLGTLLGRFRAIAPDEYDRLLRRRGIDVDPTGRLSVIDPETGLECSGKDAVRVFRRDVRLVAALQVAALESPTIVRAQIELVQNRYNPLTAKANFTFQGRNVTIPLAKIFRSEAGIAILLDRLVNTGNLSEVDRLLALAAERVGSADAISLASLELDLCRQLTHRRNFLADQSLSQPAATAVSMPGTLARRATIHGSLTPSAEPAPTEDGPVAPFDPRSLGRIPHASGPEKTEPTPGDRRIEPPTPRKPSGPITIPGG